MPPPGQPTVVSLADLITQLPSSCVSHQVSFRSALVPFMPPARLPCSHPTPSIFTIILPIHAPSAYVSFPPLRTLSTPQSTYLIVFAPLRRPIPPVRHPALPCSASPRIDDLFERLGSAAISGILVLAAYALCPSYDYSRRPMLPLLFRHTAPPFPPAGDFRIPSACSAES